MKHKKFITSKILKGLGIVIAVALLCVTVVGCGGTTTLKSIAVLQDELSLYKSGEQQLSIIATYTGGKTEEVTAQCTYESSDRMVLAVDQGGYVVALATGDAIITVTYTNTKDSVTMTITIPINVKEEKCGP